VPPAEYEASYYAQVRRAVTIDDAVGAGLLQPASIDNRGAEGIL
jgi:hypothetical protein